MANVIQLVSISFAWSNKLSRDIFARMPREQSEVEFLIERKGQTETEGRGKEKKILRERARMSEKKSRGRTSGKKKRILNSAPIQQFSNLH